MNDTLKALIAADAVVQFGSETFSFFEYELTCAGSFVCIDKVFTVMS
jgi:hypothetical protein